jgi:outer membrane protein
MFKQVLTLAAVAVFSVSHFSGGSLINTAQAADDTTKIATVDMQKALQSVDEGKKAKSQLETEFNAKKKQLSAEETSLRKITEDFKKQAAVMSDEARARKQGEIQEKVAKFQEETQKSQMEIQQKERELTDPILNRLRGVIQTIAKSRGYSTVLEKNDNVVLFSLDKDDLTTEVIAAFNKSKG